MLKREIRVFFAALMFFTRLPCPQWEYDDRLRESIRYLPLIGWIVGGLSALVLFGAARILPGSVAVLLSMVSSVLLTGAFHEDGLGDVCDSFGGGWTKTQILAVMKDSRMGAYGVVGLVLSLLLKCFLLVELAQIEVLLAAVAVVNGHTVSRFVASTFVRTHDYVQNPERSKSHSIVMQKPGWGAMLFGLLLTLMPFVLFDSWLFVLGFPIAYLSKPLLGYLFQRRIGGYTGDCLGATQQIGEIAFYLSVLAIRHSM